MQCRVSLRLFKQIANTDQDFAISWQFVKFTGLETDCEVLGYNTGDHAPGHTDDKDCAPYIAGETWRNQWFIQPVSDFQSKQFEGDPKSH